MIFERLLQETGCREVIGQLLRGRNFEFPVERAVFLTVLHRLLTSGSDRAAEKWKGTLQIEETDELQLHHLYRVMARQGEPLPEDQPAGATPISPRCSKDIIEEGLFGHRRDLFCELDLVFFDTTSIYFEGQGGDSSGQYGRLLCPGAYGRAYSRAFLAFGNGSWLEPLCRGVRAKRSGPGRVFGLRGREWAILDLNQ